MKKQSNPQANKTLPNEPRVIVDEPNVEEDNDMEQLRIHQQTATINITQVGPDTSAGKGFIDDSQNEPGDVFSRLASGRAHKHTSSVTNTTAPTSSFQQHGSTAPETTGYEDDHKWKCLISKD